MFEPDSGLLRRYDVEMIQTPNQQEIMDSWWVLVRLGGLWR